MLHSVRAFSVICSDMPAGRFRVSKRVRGYTDDLNWMVTHFIPCHVMSHRATSRLSIKIWESVPEIADAKGLTRYQSAVKWLGLHHLFGFGVFGVFILFSLIKLSLSWLIHFLAFFFLIVFRSHCGEVWGQQGVGLPASCSLPTNILCLVGSLRKGGWSCLVTIPGT